MEATLQSVIPVKRILHNREPPEHSMPETTLQPANPAKRIQLLDWLKSGIHKSEKNCPQRVSLCSTSQTCCRIFNVFFFFSDIYVVNRKTKSCQDHFSIS